MADEGTSQVERKLDEPEKSGAAQTGAKPTESEGQHREREEREQEQPQKK